MLRKSLTSLSVFALVILSACSSTTGPDSAGTRRESAGGPGNKPPQQYEKVCMSDLRSVEIVAPKDLSPTYSTGYTGGSPVLVAWETHEICGKFYASLLLSTDGEHYSLVGEWKDANSASFQFPNVYKKPVYVKVVVRDREGEVSDELVIQPVQVEPSRGPRNPHDQTPTE